MAQQYDFGMVGIGVMGSNLLLNIADHGFSVIGYDTNPDKAKNLEEAASPNTVVKGTADLKEMMDGLKRPRKIMMLVPAGKPVDDVLQNLLPYLDKDDIVIDGGNSYFKDTLRRVNYLQEKGFHFFGMGVSGGQMGARLGPSMMPGGDKDAYQYLKPILEAVAARADDGSPCVAYMGRGAAGHYVKMVHNGIEYAMLQIISEVYDVLHRGAGFSNEELHATFAQWNGGRLQSYLLEITAEVFKTLDGEGSGYLVDKILDAAGAKGTGKWTSQEAMELPVPIPTIDAAVAMRELSGYKESRTAAAKLYGPAYDPIKEDKARLVALSEDVLFFSFLIAYAQGLSMLAKASAELDMHIPLPAVVNVWKAGCIIRSHMLLHFSSVFSKNNTQQNILLDEVTAALIQPTLQSVKQLIALAVPANIPVPAIFSAFSYFQAFCTDRLPVNLIQAQRDYFGAHTYQRIDKPGVFHTEWHVGS